MSTPLQRIRRGALILACILIVAVLGYRFGWGYSWVKSIWMVIITISSVGFSEDSDTGDGFQLFTIFVIVIGMSSAAYVVGGFIQMMLEGEIHRAMGRQRMIREISQLTDHVIVCGYGRMGKMLVEGFSDKSHNIPSVVVENDDRVLEEAAFHDRLFVAGDATDEEVLKAAGVERARALLTSLPNDAENVFITLTGRNLNPKILIISRAEHLSTQKKLRQAGANQVVMPTLVGARQMVRMITRPSTADLMELVAESSIMDVELDELHLGENAALIGVDVRSTEAHRTHSLLVVAVKLPDGKMVFNPDADYVFQAGDVVMVMGHTADIDQFRRHYRL